MDEPSADEGKRVLTPGEAYEVTKVLEGVITSGTGAGYTSIGCQSEAGKTGTSEDLSDAWFVGYTPMYSTAVWTGHPLSRDSTGFGGPTSGPIWRSYMEAAQGGDCPDFEVPSSLPSLSSFHGEHTASSSSSCSSSSLLLRLLVFVLPELRLRRLLRRSTAEVTATRTRAPTRRGWDRNPLHRHSRTDARAGHTARGASLERRAQPWELTGGADARALA